MREGTLVPISEDVIDLEGKAKGKTIQSAERKYDMSRPMLLS